MKAPTCPLCSKEHWSWETHAGMGPVHNSAKSWGEGPFRADPVAISDFNGVPLIPLPVTETPRVTKSVTETPESVTKKARVTKKGRPTSGNALTPSEKQARYRQRKVEGS